MVGMFSTVQNDQDTRRILDHSYPTGHSHIPRGNTALIAVSETHMEIM